MGIRRVATALKIRVLYRPAENENQLWAKVTQVLVAQYAKTAKNSDNSQENINPDGET
jgi:hypothetical protein